MYGLGGVTYNIARTAPTMRDVARYFNAPALAPPPIAPRPATPTTLRPVVPITPVLKPPVTATPKPTVTTVKPKVPVLTPTAASVQSPSSTGVPLTSGAPLPLSVDAAPASGGDIIVGDVVTKSPLPLILIGLAALMFLNRKGR